MKHIEPVHMKELAEVKGDRREIGKKVFKNKMIMRG